MKELRFYQNFYFVTYLYGKSAHFDRKVGSPFHYFNYLAHGSGRIVSENITLELKQGDFYYIPKGLSYHSYWQSEDYVSLPSCATTIFPEAQTEPFFPASQEAKGFPQKWDALSTHVVPFKLQMLPREFLEEYLAIPRDVTPDTRTLARFYTWLEKLTPHLQREEQDPGTLLAKKASAYIDSNPGCRIPDIARHCGISESALYSTIRKATGKTPNELRHAVLVEKAVHMLKTTDKPIQTISDLLAFSSSTYFRKIISEHTGKSPSQIRKEGKDEK